MTVKRAGIFCKVSIYHVYGTINREINFSLSPLLAQPNSHAANSDG